MFLPIAVQLLQVTSQDFQDISYSILSEPAIIMGAHISIRQFLYLQVQSMELWKRQYSTVWLAFFACVLIPRWMGSMIGLPIHALLGFALLLLTQTNLRHIDALAVPDRLKRISRVMAGLAIFQLIAGMALGGILHLAPNLSFISSPLRAVHVICALAILAQASSVATAYDMWEDKEFGSVPEGKQRTDH
jgi:hypothetical protein